MASKKSKVLAIAFCAAVMAGIHVNPVLAWDHEVENGRVVIGLDENLVSDVVITNIASQDDLEATQQAVEKAQQTANEAQQTANEVAADVKTIQTNDQNQNDRLNIHESQIGALQESDKKQNETLADHENAIGGLEKNDQYQNDRLNIHESQIGALQESDKKQNGRLDSVEAVNKDQNGRLDSVEAVNKDQNGRLDSVEAVNKDQNGRLDSVEAVNKDQNGRLDSVEAVNKDQNGRLDGHDISIKNHEAVMGVTDKTGLKSAYEGATYIDKNDTMVEADRKLDAAISDVNSRVDGIENRVDGLEDRIDKVGAMSAAIANLRTMGYDPAAPTEVAVGVGQYRDETGMALGLFHYPNRDFMLSLSVSTSGDEYMGGIGATWKFGRKSPEKVAEIKKAQAEADARRAEEQKLAKAEEMKKAAKEAKVQAQMERHAKLAAERAALEEA